MKRQIHAVRGHEQVVVPGHDVKLGRGGIREIEFFVQTQQLIFGGRRPQMRGSRTLDMLERFAPTNGSARKRSTTCAQAYAFLRRVEHRLQMVADEQTQRLPFEREALTRFAKFCGYARLDGFAADLTHHLTQVERHYARLFEDAPTLSVASGNLVFTGVADDPATLATLQRAWLSASGSRSGDRSRLAFRPARGGPQRPRARGADGADAGAARSLRRIGRR